MEWKAFHGASRDFWSLKKKTTTIVYYLLKISLSFSQILPSFQSLLSLLSYHDLFLLLALDAFSSCCTIVFSCAWYFQWERHNYFHLRVRKKKYEEIKVLINLNMGLSDLKCVFFIASKVSIHSCRSSIMSTPYKTKGGAMGSAVLSGTWIYWHKYVRYPIPPSLQPFPESHPFSGNGIETKVSKYNIISSLLVYNGRSSWLKLFRESWLENQPGMPMFK